MQLAGAAALLPAVASEMDGAQVPAAPKEGTGTPKIAISTWDTGIQQGGDRASGPRKARAIIAPRKAEGITVGNLTINLSKDILYGKPGNKHLLS